MGKKTWSEHVNAILKSLRLKAEGKNPNEIAKKVGMSNVSSIYEAWNKFWKEEYPLMLKVVDAVDSLNKRRASSKVDLAEKGNYFTAPPYGAIVKDGKLFPKPDGNEYETMCSLYKDYVGPDPEHMDGASLAELHAKYPHVPKNRIQRILRDKRYIGLFTYATKEREIRGNSLLNPGLWEKAQKRHPPEGHARIKFPYRHWEGKIAVDAVKKKRMDEMVEVLLKGTYIDEETGEERLASTEKVAKKFGCSESLLRQSILREELTGFIEKNGELTPSGYPSVISRETYNKLKKTFRERRQKGKTLKAELRWKNLKPKILQFIGDKGAWRSDIQSKFKLEPDTVNRMVKALKEEDPAWIKERRDGLLYKVTLPEPKVPMMSMKKSFREKYWNIRRYMSHWITQEELAHKTGYARGAISWYLKKMDDIEHVGAYSGHSSPMYRLRPSDAQTEKEERMLKLMNMGSPKTLALMLQPMLTQTLGTIEIVRTAHMAKSSVGKWLRRLKQEGVVQKASPRLRGKWRISDEWVQPIKKLLGEISGSTKS